MQLKIDKTQGRTAPVSAAVGQVVACAVALGIMASGAWSLLSQKAPYHPEAISTEVSRGASDLTNVGSGN